MSHRCGFAGAIAVRAGHWAQSGKASRLGVVVVRAGLVGMLGVLLLAAQAGAMSSPYVSSPSTPGGQGAIAAYDADGASMVVPYYERIGSSLTPEVVGAPHQTTVSWFFSGPDMGSDGGYLPSSTFVGQSDFSCNQFEPWPYYTDPDPRRDQDHCWSISFAPSNSPGTYGIIMPPSRVVGGVGGETQVFDHWTVTNAITEGKCRAGDVGLGAVNPGGGGDEGQPLSDTFEAGPEYRVWMDISTPEVVAQGAAAEGLTGKIEAHYARVSPDISAPLVTIDPSIDCKVVKQGTASLPADFACDEPGGLGSGVASCTGRNDGNVVTAGQPLDTSTLGSHDLTVTATDNAGNTRSRTMHYTVQDATFFDHAPSALALSSTVIDENQPAGTAVGTFSTTDPDAGDTFTYQLVDGDGSTDNSSFTIDGDTLKATASFDYETKNSYSVRVRTTDALGKSFEQTFTIFVVNVPEPTLTPATIAENQPIGTLVGQLGVDGDLLQVWGFELVSGPGDTDNGSFAVAGSQVSGPAQLVTAASFDYETKRTYTIRVGVRYGCSCTIFEQSLTISVTDVNEAPTAIALSNAAVAENQPAGTSVGTLSTTDPDAGDTSTYQLVTGAGSTDNSSFTIDGDTLKTTGSSTTRRRTLQRPRPHHGRGGSRSSRRSPSTSRTSTRRRRRSRCRTRAWPRTRRPERASGR